MHLRHKGCTIKRIFFHKNVIRAKNVDFRAAPLAVIHQLTQHFQIICLSANGNCYFCNSF